ncbi:uncharacterized protein LOC125240079 [Leguminivora glycinivorella]|uniref:uncharacterized protein LOC125240079 n=1 Tax=Leguminivora glycinivorella TaxID=1035111 RepID=UPI00200C001D|nr:uncharacterized protein LOC125240079 [Leguminivora glycinivorella]
MTSTEFTDLRSCGCCLLRASQVSDSRIFGDINTKIHWIMLKECFNIQAIEASEYGICQKCVYCLRNAYSFKLQVQRSQAELELQRSKAELEMQRNQAELQARLKTLLAKDSLDKERDELEVDYRMSEDIAEITDPLLNVDVIIKLEREESIADSTAGDLEQSPLISSEQYPRDCLLRGNTGIYGFTQATNLTAAMTAKNRSSNCPIYKNTD